MGKLAKYLGETKRGGFGLLFFYLHSATLLRNHYRVSAKKEKTLLLGRVSLAALR